MNNIRIGVRLTAGFLIILALAIALGVFAINRLAAVNGATQDIATNWLAGTRFLGTYRGDIDWLRRVEAQHVMSSADADYKHWEDKAVELRGKTAADWKQYQSVVTPGTEQELATAIVAAEKKYLEAQTTLMKFSRDSAGGNIEAVRQMYTGPSLKALKALQDAVDKDIDYQSKGADAAYQSSQDAYLHTRNAVIAALFAALAIGAALSWFITRSITTPVAEALKLAETVASGDLSTRIQVSATDEFGQLLRALAKMNDTLSGVVTQVRNSTDSMATGVQQIASGNADLSQRTEEQASNLQQTAASMEELTATVQQNTDAANQANQLAMQASSAAEQGGQAVDLVVGTMGDIAQSSKRIADIIGVIDGIAFQTNILALNAAVEAARAGEQGRGFAVVASEVRSLAQRSAQAAREIKTLIEDSVGKVSAGTEQVANAGKTMGEIVARVKRVSDLVGEISTSGREQNTGIGQVGDAIQQLDRVTQQNAALVEESAAASESLQQQAHQLVQVVGFFKCA
ncbi:MAG: methyl-accepting chemotaxis protein [Burkholderiaceae bacterium]